MPSEKSVTKKLRVIKRKFALKQKKVGLVNGVRGKRG
jgi:hypothetical protein